MSVIGDIMRENRGEPTYEGQLKKRVADLEKKLRDTLAETCLLADIRTAAGYPEGKLMQDELVAHIAALREDKARLDWIENVICGEDLSLYHALDPHWGKNKTLRQAIDDAIDAAKGGQGE